MNADLLAVIRHFRAAQDLAVETLRDQLGIPMPTSNYAWAEWSHGEKTPQHLALHELGQRHGLHIRTHGFGVELRFPNLCIDFDWGDCGEGYGFDVWRLWNHCCENRIYLDQFTHKLLKSMFEHTVDTGELVYDRHLHYLPEERAKFGARPPTKASSVME
jgi:hypothetical protein